MYDGEEGSEDSDPSNIITCIITLRHTKELIEDVSTEEGLYAIYPQSQSQTAHSNQSLCTDCSAVMMFISSSKRKAQCLGHSSGTESLVTQARSAWRGRQGSLKPCHRFRRRTSEALCARPVQS